MTCIHPRKIISCRVQYLYNAFCRALPFRQRQIVNKAKDGCKTTKKLFFTNLQNFCQDLLPPGGVLGLHDDPFLRVQAIPRAHRGDLVHAVSILARFTMRVAVVVDDGEAGPHNGLSWIVGVLLAEVHVVPSVRVGITKSTQ